MPAATTFVDGHRRASSSSTVRAAADAKGNTFPMDASKAVSCVEAALWVHDDGFSHEEIIINPSILRGSRIVEGSLIEVVPQRSNTAVIDFEDVDANIEGEAKSNLEDDSTPSTIATCLCIAKFATSELLTKHPGLEVSLTKTIAEAFKLHSRTQVMLKSAGFDNWTASHIELSFRDAYLARSDMWRLVSHELVNRVIYKGQKISFLGSMKLTVKEVHVRGHRVSTGFFSGTTIPIFRSEAARYVLFIQMSGEMWDFDSEGNGEIMFNRVINGFLPDLFRRWAQLEVRHLVSIVLFGRLEYDRYDLGDSNPATAAERFSQSSSISSPTSVFHQDFFRVVVTDMASAQWTTILSELKKDFRVFLRDISLHTPVSLPAGRDAGKMASRITGRPSTAMKGNILEAINLASSQFANDYIDRDLIRTGVSTIVITAGTGVFDVDRDLLNLTSENLTNNGIGIDIVCLSKMPLHSVPLFRYRLPLSTAPSRAESSTSMGSHGLDMHSRRPSVMDAENSSALSSFTGTSASYFSRFPSAFPSKIAQPYGYGIPHWIDLSYWSHSFDGGIWRVRQRNAKYVGYRTLDRNKPFIPRVRMYELQMMGLMELGMADISIPYIAETSLRQKRPRHKNSADLALLASAKNLSQSPSYFRKTSTLIPRHRESVSMSAQRPAQLVMSEEKMDEYDELLFLDTSHQKPHKHRRHKNRSSNYQHKTAGNLAELRSSVTQYRKQISERDLPTLKPSSIQSSERGSSVRSVSGSSNLKPGTNPPRISRSISYALRGLRAPLRSSATSEVSMDNIKALPSAATTSLTQANATASLTNRAESIRSTEARDIDTRSILSNNSANEKHSKPISITGSSYRPVSQQVSSKLEMPIRTKPRLDDATDKHHIGWSGSPSESSENEVSRKAKDLGVTPDSVRQTAIPFIRSVNASNPLKRKWQSESLFGRWQHLYPHKPRASTVKWRSLCTPASVPLTTEDFPTARDLAEEYDIKEHRVHVKRTDESNDVSASVDTLLKEMIILRLSHGYQIVIGEAVRKVVGRTLCETSVFVDPGRLSKYGDTIVMCMGNTIQKLIFTDSDFVQVSKYIKKDSRIEYPFTPLFSYNPNIRTILSTEYWSRSMELRGFSEEYPWETADNHLTDGQIDSADKANKLRFWRARFVFLPVEPPASSWKPQQASEENEEEIHLRGIRALTEMWQKARHFSPLERKVGQGRMGSTRRKDLNPLEIKFDTLNTSELIATELDKVLALEESGETASTQLLPDSERLDRHTTMAKIAQAMQGEKGIEIKNRRWHLRLHYNCFNGEELTNWLLQNVKNTESREEAVEFGNQLMKEGLFEHVNGRHNFKDGVYFYSLKQDFKIPKIDVKQSWFPGARRTDRSVPPTPLSEQPSREISQTTTRSRSGSSLTFSLNPPTPLDSVRSLVDRRKKTVTLTKMIKIDVDPRKRSDRSELINLHYDRFHNPENCYHIELSWFNTTSKLVDDAIVAWTKEGEKYGLKVVEVPLAEASKIPNAEPFRRAYQFKLAIEPPKKQPVSHVLTSNSFTPQPYPNQEKHFYQKAILKRFNFVLDLEGVSEFPDNVDIQYSSSGLAYKHTQFIHRSGVILAQINDEGEFSLLANRLYNARFVNSKDANNSKFDNRRETGPGTRLPLRPQVPQNIQNSNVSLQASGIIGLNMQSPHLPASPVPSPTTRATADVFGSRSALFSSSVAQYVTPEQIKDELEHFCNDPVRLEKFYNEFGSGPASTNTSTSTSQLPATMHKRSTGGTSSSALKPIQDANEGIPEFVLPESLTSPSTSTGSFGMGFGGLMSRRSRPSVAYESVAEMFGRAGLSTDRFESSKERKDSNGHGNGNHSNDNRSTRHNSAENSGRTSGDVSGHLELRIRVDTPGGSRRIEEGIEEGMKDSIGSPRSLGKGSSPGSKQL